MINHEHYTYRVTWSEEDGEFVAQCLEFPSLSFLAETSPDALAGMLNLVKDVVQDMLENGEKPPEPLADKNYSGQIMLRMTPELHRILAISAAEQGVSLNKYINLKLV